MFFPTLKKTDMEKVTVTEFPGLDRRESVRMGGFRKMKNLCSEGYPALRTRPARGLSATVEKPEGLIAKDALLWVDGRRIYVNGLAAEPELTAREAQKSMEALQPKEYQSSFEGELAQLYDQITGRKAFSYDPQTDAQAKNYAYLYTQKGREAMADTMGQAAALTGGYASSYAQTASQQAYDRYMRDLAELMPELEKNARQRDESQRDWLMQQYEQVSSQEQEAYKRYQQEQAAWQDSYDRAGKEADALWEREYANYKLMLQHYTGMAGAEQKASGGARANSGAPTAAAEKKATLSSTAMDSLQRAMGNYLKGGKTAEAAALAQQYGGRMTAAQKEKPKKLFGNYGAQLAL